MTLLNGLILGLGGLLLAIPIILHFLMQPKPKELVFPALKFIKKKQIKNRRQMRVRHVLLLLLRCFLILAIAAALAGPTVATGNFGNWMTLGVIGLAGLIVGGGLIATLLRGGSAPLLRGILTALLVAIFSYGAWVAYQLWKTDTAPVIGNNQAPVAAVLVLDTSPRMLYQHENITSLDRAKEMAKWLIGQFPVDSEVSILLTDGESPYFSVDVSAAKKRLETSEVSYTPTTVPESLLEGLQLVKSSELERKEVYVLSDLTLRSWSGADTRKFERILKEESPSIYVIDTGSESPVNFSINQIRIAAATMARDDTLQIEADVLRRGPAAERTVRMKLENRDPRLPVFQQGRVVLPEGGWENSQNVSVGENGGKTLEFRTSQKLSPGTHYGVVEIVGSDGLSIDDQKYFTIQISDAWKVLLIHPPNVPVGQMQALVEEPMFECELVPESDFSSVDLTKYNAVYWLNPTPQSDTTWNTLTRYVEGGGGLGIMLGHNAQDGPSADRAFTTEAAQVLLTGQLTFPFSAPASKRPNIPRGFFLSPQGVDHPILAGFRSFETNINWARFPIQMHWGIEPDESDYPTQTVMRFNNRESALIERQIGAGRVVVLTTPFPEPSYPDEDRSSWNKLLVGNIFPIWFLMRQTTLRLVDTSADTLNLGIGDAAKLKNDDRIHPDQYFLFTPDLNKSPMVTKVSDNMLRHKFTDLPGHYRFKGTTVLGTIQRGFSVNLSPSETDLGRIETDQLDSILGEGKYQLAREQDEIERKQGKLREGQSFYPMLIFLMLVILAVEYLMSNRFYGLKSTPQPATAATP